MALFSGKKKVNTNGKETIKNEASVLSVDSARLRPLFSTNMQSKNIIPFLLLFSLFSFSLNCSGKGPFPESDVRDLHLVIDAGSSGTRFCLYRMQFTSSSSNSCKIKQGECRSVVADDGLAALPPEKAKEALRGGFASLTEAQKNRIVHVSLLGTGGFRRLSSSAQKTAMTGLAEAIFETGLPATVRVISGEEEALLAWRSIHSETGSNSHAIIETGGATVQVATGTDGRVNRSISLPLGMNETRSHLKKESACFSAPSADRFDTCKRELLPLLGPLRQWTVPERNTYGLGNPYAAIFKQLDRDEIRRTDIDARGRLLCASDSEQMAEYGIAAEHQKLTCYLFAFHSAQLELLGVESVQKGSGSWPPGAALSPEFFPSCR
ncbi:hypothetical protein Lepil_1270 [Leptonema illini DSM 21528]|uniref:Ppx/GppA phosphatase N-terminal domain-containing protein n=2 Tax=Leptonema illini TaxID=183 RepID=H2CIG8_9LEPT|nr:hypothetical protein Lepil_1270 [Leptonema illini DSM 21528]